LQGKDSIPELNALIEILSKDGKKWQVQQSGKGTYKSLLNIPTNQGLSLRIQTTRREDLSDPFSKSIDYSSD